MKDKFSALYKIIIIYPPLQNHLPLLKKITGNGVYKKRF